MHPGPALFAPYWRPPHDEVVMLLHMNVLPLVDDVGRTITTTGSGISLTTGVGTSVGQFDKAAVWDTNFNSWVTMVNDSKMDFGSGPGPTFDIWLRGLPSTSHDNIVFAVAKSAATGQYGMVTLVANSDGGVAHYSVYLSDTTANNSWIGAGAVLAASGAPPASTDPYRHIRFGRCDDTTWKLAVDGVISSTYTTAAGLVFNGTVGLDHGLTWVGNAAPSGPLFIGNPWSGSPMDELVARKTWMDTANFTPPAIPFVYP